jgi:DHA1 family tetracycline resistance protein-like MFS transporter
MSAPAAAPPRRGLGVLFAVVVLDLVGFGIVMPVLPFWAQEFGAGALAFGLLQSSYAAAQFVCAPLWGRLSDRAGRRPVLLFTIAGTSLAMLATGLAPSLAWLFAARVLAGAFAANISVASAYITDVTPPEERTRWMGLLGASFGVGFVIGPALGALLVPYGHAVPMYFTAGLAALNWCIAALRLAEPARHEAAARSGGRLALLRDPAVRGVVLANLAFSLAVTQLETLFPYLLKDGFGWGARPFALILFAMAIVMGAIQGGGMKALSARYAERQLVVSGVAVLALGFAGVPVAPGVALLLGALLLAAVGRAVAQPALLSLASQAARPEERGAVMGAFQSSASLARVVGPALGGFLYGIAIPYPFWLASALLVGIALSARRLPRGAAGRERAAA